MNRLRTALRIAYPVLRNKFAVTGLLFVIWVGFIDQNNVIAQVKARLRLAEIRRERDFYHRETQQSLNDLRLLQNDRQLLERFARERYLMKRPEEDIFIFTTED